MNYDEFAQIQAAPQNMLLMIKKYVPDSYESYVEILSEAAIIGIQHQDKIMELIQRYRQNTDAMPQWIHNLANSKDMPEDEYEYMLKYNGTIISHINDDDIAEILKTLTSLSVSEK